MHSFIISSIFIQTPVLTYLST